MNVNSIRLWTLVCLACAVVLSAQSLRAGVLEHEGEMWTNAPSVEGWQEAGPATIENPGTGGADGVGDGYLRISFAAYGGPPVFQSDLVYADFGDYIGSYQEGALQVSFEFYVEDVLPSASVVYLHSTVSGGTWKLAFNNTQVGTWQQHVVLFDYDAGWYGVAGGADQFWADLANIDWIGINISRWSNAEYDYGLDNWAYKVPEPCSAGILAAACLSVAFAVSRRKKNQLI
jgi:hypothetical protein